MRYLVVLPFHAYLKRNSDINCYNSHCYSAHCSMFDCDSNHVIACTALSLIKIQTATALTVLCFIVMIDTVTASTVFC